MPNQLRCTAREVKVGLKPLRSMSSFQLQTHILHERLVVLVKAVVERTKEYLVQLAQCVDRKLTHLLDDIDVLRATRRRLLHIPLEAATMVA